MFPWHKNKGLIVSTGITFMAAMIIMMVWNKTDIHIFLNSFHSGSADFFFKYITNLGDGIFVIIITLILLFWKIKYAVYNLSVYLLSGIFVQMGKRLVWPDAPRPSAVFQDGILHFVEGVKLHGRHSFPSGHSASAFGLFFVLLFISGNQSIKWIYLFLAMITAYSRIYISQHFLVDIVAGGIIGFLCALVLYKPVIGLQSNWANNALMKIKR